MPDFAASEELRDTEVAALQIGRTVLQANSMPPY
jgi:hypothetical protein